MMSFDLLFSRDAGSFRASPIRAFAKLINEPGVISFAGGVPNPQTFPAERIAEIASRLVRERANVALQYGPTRGLPRLCESIATICRDRGIACAAEDVLTTTGSQQALSLLAHTLLDPGDVVAVELPTYVGGSAAFYARGAKLVGIAQDDEGIVPESLAEAASRHRIKLLYTIPNFQNPSGRLMTRERRSAVVALAREHGFLVIEDDPYGELVYTPDAYTTPIKARDVDGHVVYLGSFSKVLAPGLRTGWIVGPKALLERLEIAKQSADLCSAMLDQSIIDEYVASGELAQQIARVREFYRGKRATLIEALTEHFSGRAEWTPADGGLFTFVTFHDDVDTAARVPDAVAKGVAFIPGSPFFVDGSGRNTMRLTFAKESDERIREGVAKLASVFA